MTSARSDSLTNDTLGKESLKNKKGEWEIADYWFDFTHPNIGKLLEKRERRIQSDAPFCFNQFV